MKKMMKRTKTVFIAMLLIVISGMGVSFGKTPHDMNDDPNESGETVLPKNVSADWWSSVQQNIRDSEYHISSCKKEPLPGVKAIYQSPNRAHDFRTYFTAEGFMMIPRRSETQEWSWGMNLIGYGYEDRPIPVEKARLDADKNRLEYRRDGLVEWYVNDEKGLEQGFTLLSPPETGNGKTGGQVVLTFDITGD